MSNLTQFEALQIAAMLIGQTDMPIVKIKKTI